MKAREVINSALNNYSGCISYQVIQQFLNVATQKFVTPLTIKDCHRYITDVLGPLCEIFSSIDLYKSALEIKEGWRYSFYDSLIISAALSANCNILFSGDLQHNQKIQDLTILNPFTRP
ncbi:MAG: PIN domain-containing protein [candidate division KSB1 bacterium]|nr:PIN domain-containing protein [candidate division KSB1 bacterium]